MGNAVTVLPKRGLVTARRRVNTAVTAGRRSLTGLGVPKVPVGFASEMEATIKACQGRSSDYEDVDDDADVAMLTGAADEPLRPTRQVRDISSEFRVDAALLHAPKSNVVAVGNTTVHDLTKAKLLAYYARRTDGEFGRGTRARAASFSELPQVPLPSAEDEHQNTSVSGKSMSGSLRAARTQRLYSEPPVFMADSFGSIASDGSVIAGSQAPGGSPRSGHSSVGAGGRSCSVLDTVRALDGVVPEDDKEMLPGVPHFRPPEAVRLGVAVH